MTDEYDKHQPYIRRDWKVEFDRWLAEHDRAVSEAAWARGRRESTDLVSDATGFRVVAVNADNPYTAHPTTPDLPTTGGK